MTEVLSSKTCRFSGARRSVRSWTGAPTFLLNSSVHSSQHAKKTKMINIVNTKTEMRKTEMNDCDKRAARIAFTQSTDSGPVGAGEASLGSCTKGPALIIVHRKRSCHGEGLLLLSMSACAQVETPPPRKVCRPSTRTIPARGSCEARGPHGELRAGAWLRALPGSAWREPCGRAHLSNPDGRHGRRPPKHRTAVVQTRRPALCAGPAVHGERTASFELGHGSRRRCAARADGHAGQHSPPAAPLTDRGGRWLSDHLRSLTDTAAPTRERRLEMDHLRGQNAANE